MQLQHSSKPFSFRQQNQHPKIRPPIWLPVLLAVWLIEWVSELIYGRMVGQMEEWKLVQCIIYLVL